MKEIAVISGKGGTGKSSISAAFAIMGNNVVIADCDVDAANLYLLFNPSVDEEQVYVSGHKAVIDYSVCSNCGYCIDYCRFEALLFSGDKVIVDDISCDGCFLCSRICPENALKMLQNDKSRLYSGSFRNGKMVYGRLAPSEENSGRLVNMVRDKAKQIAEENDVDTIILDGPPGIGCPVISTITGVDRVIIVTEPTISGLMDLQRAAAITLKFDYSPLVIINKYNLNPSMTGKIKAWCKKENLKVIGILPFDKKVTEGMIQQKTILEFDPENEISSELRKIWEEIKILKT